RGGWRDRMPGMEGNGDQVPGLPVEHMRFDLTRLPDFGGAAPLDDQHDFFVEMPLDVEGTGARHLNHVAAPQPFGAVELNVAAAAADPLPGRERQLLHPAHPHAAIDLDPLRVPETIVRHRRALETPQSGVFTRLRFMT